MKTVTERIFALARHEVGDPRKVKSELARICGISYNAVVGWEKNPQTNVHHENLLSISRAWGASLDWLMTGRGPSPIGGVMESPGAYSRQAKFTALPLISSVQAGAWGEAEDPYALGGAAEWVHVPGVYGSSAFMLCVEGDSMTSFRGGISIPAGSQVVVDPEVEATNGSIVVAKLEQEQKVTIKRLVIEPPYKYLMPINDRYDRIPINGECRIVGVVRKVIQDV